MERMAEADRGMFAADQRQGSASSVRLGGRLRTGTLMMAVLALSAPICVAAGFIPLVIAANGPAAPLAFIATGVVMLLFAVGYVTMAGRVRKPGAFYTFIAAGLAKPTGLGAAYLAFLSYGLVSTGSFVFFGLQAQILVHSFGGPALPWVIYAALCWAGTALVGHFNIALSAKVLEVAMILEVVIVMIFNIAVFVKNGPAGLPLEPLSPLQFIHGDIASALVFGILIFIGFEATALYRDETVNPDRTIPRATYGAVVFIGILYFLTCYALMVAYGPAAVSLSKTDPASMFSKAIGVWVAPMFTQIVLGMVLISQFAALLSFHNVLSRYAHSLSVDHALPNWFAAVHPEHKSPYRASGLIAVLIISGILGLSLTSIPGQVLYAQMSGLGAFGIMVLMALVSIAVLNFFLTQRRESDSVWKTILAPAAASLVLCSLIIFSLGQFEILVGGAPGESLWMPMILGLSVLLGSAVALYYRTAKPDVYARLGRSSDEIDEVFHVDGGILRK